MTKTQAPTDKELAVAYEASEHERALASLALLNEYLRAAKAKKSAAKKR